MPAQAIETSKRKFYKALDQFTASQTSLTPSTTASASVPKRPATAAAAFDEARERAAKRLRHSTSSSSLPPKAAPSPTPSRQGDGKPRDPPNFSPWSHETFLARLKTFSSVSLWHPKPEGINEVEWAKRGWQCVDVNTVSCKGGCEKRLVVSLDISRRTSAEDEEDAGSEDQEAEEHALEQALVQRYQDVIAEGHADTCMWRKAGCKDDIYRLQVVLPSVWQPELRQRYKSILGIGKSVQHVNVKPIEAASSTSFGPERLLKELPSEILESATQTEDVGSTTKALDLAMHGWRGSTESGNELLHCDACFQRIGLWMYQPDYKTAHSRSDDESEDDIAIIDGAEMHREHCPWRSPSAQQASGSLKGLNASQILQRVVTTCARDHRRRSDEHAAVRHPQDVQAEPANTVTEDMPVYSKEEVARQDKERESRLRKLKGLFSIKRRSTKTAPKT